MCPSVVILYWVVTPPSSDHKNHHNHHVFVGDTAILVLPSATKYYWDGGQPKFYIHSTLL